MVIWRARCRQENTEVPGSDRTQFTANDLCVGAIFLTPLLFGSRNILKPGLLPIPFFLELTFFDFAALFSVYFLLEILYSYLPNQLKSEAPFCFCDSTKVAPDYPRGLVGGIKSVSLFGREEKSKERCLKKRCGWEN